MSFRAKVTSMSIDIEEDVLLNITLELAGLSNEHDSVIRLREGTIQLHSSNVDRMMAWMKKLQDGKEVYVTIE